MSVGEMCVLIPKCTGQTTYVEKFNQLRRRSVVPRCLFGPPDPEDTERMFQEHMKYNRERMLKKYNIDILEHGPDRGTQLLLVLMKHETKRLNELRSEEEEELNETGVKTVPVESRIPTETRLSSESSSSSTEDEDSPSLEDNFRPIDSHSSSSSLKLSTEKSTKACRTHPYASRQSQLTEFWRSRRHLKFDNFKTTPSSLPRLPLITVPRFEGERRRD